MSDPGLRQIKAWAVLAAVFGAAALFTGSSIAAKSGSASPPSHFYVSPTGRPSAVGSESDPWDLATALNAPPAILPGDTLWLRGGTYPGAFTSRLAGTSDAPILVRAVPGQRVTLDGVGSGDRNLLEILGRNTWFVDLEFTNSHPNRRTNEPGPFPQDLTRGSAIGMGDSVGIRLLNLVIHDTSGVGFWSAGVDTEISGSLIYYNGWVGPDGSHGHGIYAQNRDGRKLVSDNLVFRNFSHGLHAYTEDGNLDNISVENNAFFGNGEFQLPATGRNLLLGGSNVARDPRVIGNLVYNSFPPIDRPASSFDIGYEAGCFNPTIRDNYVADNSYLVRCSSGTILGNLFYGTLFGFSPSDLPGNVYLSSRPTGTRVFVRANAWEPGRANVIIFNWDRRSAVEVDLSSVLSRGDVFEVRNAQDFFGQPVVTGTFAGGPVALPMTALTTAIPVGWPPPPPTGPEFNAFVVRTTQFGRTTARPLLPRPSPILVPPRRTG